MIHRYSARHIQRGYINLLLAWAIAKLEIVEKYKTLGEIPEGGG